MRKRSHKRSAGAKKTAKRKTAGKSARRPRAPVAARGRATPKVVAPTPEEEAAFTATVIQTGEAARLDEHGRLPRGATLKIVEDEAGNVKVIRRRYSMA